MSSSAELNYAVSTEILSLPETSLARSGYKFSPNDDMWIIPDTSHTRYFNFKVLESRCTDELIHSLKRTLLFFLREKSASHSHNMFSQFKNLLADIAPESRVSEITSSHIISYKGNLPKANEWYLGALSGFLKKWHELGYPGVDAEVHTLLNELRIKGNRKGWAVLTFDPEYGPFDEIELNGIHNAVNTAYAEGNIGNREFSLIWLFMAIGARPVQVAATKIKDFSKVTEKGVVSYLINIPRAKQRRSLLRKKFKCRPLIPEVGEVLESWIAQIKHIHAAEIADGIAPEELPLFPVWNSESAPGFAHHPEAVFLNREMQKTFSLLNVHSHRTSESMRITPQRFRYTLGTRAAMEKLGVMVIAEMLDHNDTQNAMVYVKCTPEIIDQLDKALASELAPLANAFAGKIITDDSKAKHSDDPTSLVRYPKLDPKNGGIGRCGGCGDCHGLVPIACYVCRNFQAWSDAPHDEVLQDLLEQRQRLLEETGDERIAFANDHVILAVTQVVQKCNEIKEAR